MRTPCAAALRTIALTSFGKQEPAVAGAGVKEVIADARVAADALAHLLDIGAYAVGHARQLVHEADAGGQHAVGGVLGELGAGDVHHQKPVVVADEGRIQRAHQVDGALVLGAHDDAVGLA
jgi:hypothetical protein